jgi:hypothetical protein
MANTLKIRKTMTPLELSKIFSTTLLNISTKITSREKGLLTRRKALHLPMLDIQ